MFNSATNILKIATSNSHDINLYNLILTASISQTISETIFFTLDVQLPCKFLQITKDPTKISAFSYDISVGNLAVISTISWSHNYPNYCSAISYTLIDTDTNFVADSIF